MKHLILILTICTLIACEKKKEEDTTTTETLPTDGSQSASQLAGTGSYCEVTTSLGGGNLAVVHNLTLTAGGVYSYALYVSDATTCATSQGSGGNNTATYSQGGTFTVGGTAVTPSTGTKIVFTPATSSLIIRSGTYVSIQAFATHLNARCVPNPSFSTVANDTKTMSGNSCSSNGGYSAIAWVTTGQTYTNIIYRNGTTLSMGQSSNQDIWRAAGSSYPTTYTNTYLGWN